MKEAERTLDSQLWHACAGGMVQMPPVNSKVFYFPQGHAEHSQSTVDFGTSANLPPVILCRLAVVKFMADSESDEVYAKLRLVPLGNTGNHFYDDDDVDDRLLGSNGSEVHEKPASFAKTLTQSDANNGGGFSVPRYCAETIFPPLDYTADPPFQTLTVKDVHGEAWKFRHIYRGTPRRHLLTTGWSNFVNKKKLVAGDSIVFMRADNGDLCVGIRRAKRGFACGSDSPSRWNPVAANCASHYGGFSAFLRGEENKLMRNGSGNPISSGNSRRGGGKVRPETVVEAASLAINGQPFEVVYYPRASGPEFCVKASSVRTAMRIQWCPGLRFKMAFETEDSSRISWFMGTISSVQVADPFLWPDSPWRLLQVTWDEPDLLQNVTRVSPWLVELVSNMSVINLSPFLPPRKKLRVPPNSDFPPNSRFPTSSFYGHALGPSSPLCCLADNIPAGIQGARHAQFGILSLFNLQPENKLHPEIFPETRNSDENVSCLLTMGISPQNSEKSDSPKTRQFVLFGRPILTEEQISLSSSGDSQEKRTCSPENLSSSGFNCNTSLKTSAFGLNTGICKVFMESEDVGRTIDLSAFGSYEDLFKRLANMFGIERFETLCHVLYRDATGVIKQAGDEPFSEFIKTANRLTILTESSSNHITRTWMTRLPKAETGLGTSNKTGPLSIFA